MPDGAFSKTGRAADKQVKSTVVEGGEGTLGFLGDDEWVVTHGDEDWLKILPTRHVDVIRVRMR
jgi:hypothetical protein